jgi:hypothetical protein
MEGRGGAMDGVMVGFVGFCFGLPWRFADLLERL